MSTITNGASYRCIWWWTQHFEDEKENIRTEIINSKGLISDNIRDLLCEMQTLADAARPDDARWKNFMSVFDISPHPGKEPTEEQWDRMRQIIEEERGLKGEVFFVIEQEKADGRKHRHLIELRIDLETGRAIPDNWDAPKCHAASRRMCEEFGWEPVASPFDKDREGPRPERAPKRWESYRAMQSGLSIADITAEATELHQQSENGQDFAAALDRHGYILARGDKKTAGELTLMIIDPAGDEHSLARRLKGVTTKQLNEFMRDVDRAALPDIRQAQQMQLDRKIAALEADRDRYNQTWEQAVMNAAIEQEQAQPKYAEPEQKKETRAGRREKEQQQQAPAKPPELGKTQAEIRLARVLSPGPQSFANTLEGGGFILAAITPADIEKDLAKLREEWGERRRNPQSWMEHEGGYAALPKEFQESARRSFEEWEARKQQEQPRQQQAKQFTPDEYLTRVQKEWAEELRQRPATDNNEAQEKKRQKQLEDYVDFVQRKWAEGPKSQLERATGGLAVVTPFGSVYTLTPRNTGLNRDELPEYLKGIDRAPLLSVTDAQAVMEDVREHRRAEWQHQHEEWLMRQPTGATAAGIRLAYNLTQTGPEFAAAIEDRGLILACTTEADVERLNRWERQRLRDARAAQAPEQEGKKPRKERDLESYEKYQAGELVVINQYGSVFQLTAATTGAHTPEREERLKEIDRAPLMDVTAAQAAMQQYQQHQRQEWRQQRQDNYRQSLNEKVSPVAPPQPERQSASLFAQAANEAAADHRVEDMHGPAAEVWDTYRRAGNEHHFETMHEAPLRHSTPTGDREAFAAALEEHGITFARVSKEEAYTSHRQAAFAREIGNYAPRYKEGEIVIITEPRLEYRKDGQPTEPRRVFKLDPSLARKFLKTLGTPADKLQSIEATLKASDQRAEQRREEWAENRLERATDLNGSAWTLAGKAARAMNTGANTAARIMDTAPRAINAALGIGTEVSGMVFSLLKLIDAPKSPRLQARQNWEGEKATAERNAEGEAQIDFSKYTSDQAQERRNHQEQQAARDRQRESERERF